MSQQMPMFNLAETERKLSDMELESVMQALLKVRTTQRIGSKKRAAKRAAERKARPRKIKMSISSMTQLALGTPSPVPGYGSLYDFILSEADKRADAHLAAKSKESA